MTDSAKIVICDDHVMFSDMLGEFLGSQPDLEVVHTQNSTDGILEILTTTKPDLLLSDLVLPGPDIFDTIGQVLKKHPQVRIVVMSGMFNAANTGRLHKAGVHGIVSKMGAVTDILKVVKLILSGQVYYPKKLLASLAQNSESATPKISKREQEVMLLIAKGLSEKEIAAQLGLSDSTVNNHKGNIFSKLGVQNQVSMVVEGIRFGFIPNPILSDQESPDQDEPKN